MSAYSPKFVTHGLRLQIVCLVLLFLAGCGSPPQAPFSKFAEATKALETSADAFVAGLESPAHDRIMGDVVAGRTTVDKLLLVPGDDPLSVATVDDAPYLLKIPTFRAALLNFNRALSGYAASLKSLADGALTDDAGIDALATQTNASVRATRDTLKLTQFDDGKIAIFSTIATEAFRAYQKSKQRSSLLKAMNDVQTRMPDISEFGMQATIVIALAMRKEYQDSSGSFARIVSDAAKPEADRRSAVDALLRLNRTYSTQIAALASLCEAYGTLPQAHEQLILATEKTSALDAIQLLLTEAKRIDALHETLKAPPK